jgi:hypothetical protein
MQSWKVVGQEGSASLSNRHAVTQIIAALNAASVR